jgi:hypothetical protein
VASYPSISDASPEVTIEPADNGFVVRHYQRGAKKDESGRTIRRVASSTDEALEHARTALGGAGKSKSPKRKPLRDGQTGAGSGLGTNAAEAGEQSSSPAAHSSRVPSRDRARRRRARVGGRR